MSDAAKSDWSNYEQKSQQRLKQAEESMTQQNELYPKRGILHKIFILYSCIVGLTAALLGIGNFLTVFYEDVGTNSNDILRYIISVYLLIMLFTAVIVELEWTLFIAESKLLIFWISRGMIYVFIGVLSLNQNQLYGTKNPFGESFVNVLSYMMMSCGIGYTVMGTLCLQVFLNRCRFDFKARTHVAGQKKNQAIQDDSDQPSGMELT